MKTSGHWVVYERRGPEYVPVSKPFKTKQDAEKERERLQQGLKRKTTSFGVGFVGSA